MNKFYASAKNNLPIAIIGMGMRFPAAVRTEAEMWETLASARSCISEVPSERWPVGELSHPERGEPGRSVTFRAGILEKADEFDAAFFGISPREAAWMDPQQRLLLEMAHDAMEDAGIPPRDLKGSNCGVYVGISGMDYGQNALGDLASMSPWTMTGNTLSIAANRISWVYDLHGPSLAIDTACSSSLAAIHQACQAIRNGEIPLALAGGVNVLMHPYAFIGFSLASMLSAKGECRPFDASASGYVRGEGGGLFLLKPLARALEDGDNIHAVIMGSGVNSDGSRKSGLTIPSSEAQTELMRSVLQQSGLGPEDIDFVEAHGTGTPVGDPAEAKSIGLAYGSGRKNALPISSAKANFGHLEPASGMAGMVRAILSLKNRQIPPMPFNYAPNPEIPFSELNIFCAAAGYPLETRADKALVCAVNSFGFGGLNAHALLTEAPVKKRPDPEIPSLPPLFLSAHTDKALRELSTLYAEQIEKDESAYGLIAAGAAKNRDFMERRLAVLGSSVQEKTAALRTFAQGDSSSQTSVNSALPGEGGLAYIFSGNGSQWAGMGRKLIEESKEFRSAIESLDAELKPALGWSVKDAILAGDAAFLEDTAHAQPMLFAMQAALTMLLQNFGLKAQASAGHSVGEIAAAWAAGKITLSEAIRVVHARSVAQGHTRGKGKMTAVGLGAQEAAKLIEEERLDSELEIAAANSARNSTVSGSEAALEKLEAILTEKNIFFRRLDLDYAFHSRAMDSEADELSRLLANLNPASSSEALFVSTVTATPLEGSDLDSHYWWRNMREMVNFTEAIKTLYDNGSRIFVEIGPHAVLQRYIRETLGDNAASCRIIPLMQRENAGIDRIMQVGANLHLLLGTESFKKFFPAGRVHTKLPLYPWQKERHSFPKTSERQPLPRRKWKLLGWPVPGPEPLWENILDPRKDGWLYDHQIEGATVLAGAAWIEIALEAGQAWLGSTTAGLEHLSIKLPLVFENNHAQTIHTSINPADGSFRILSRPRLDSGEWIEHARGRIIPLHSNAGQLPLSEVTGKSIDSSALYEHTKSMGLEYGPFFRRVKNLNFKDCQLSGNLAESGNENFILHPGAIDACFHSLSVLYDKAGSAFLPVGANTIAVYSTNAPASFRGSVQKVSRRSILANFQLLDSSGRLIASLDGCVFRKIPRSSRQKIAHWQTISQFSPLPRAVSPSALFSASPDLGDDTLPLKNFGAERNFWHQDILQNLEAMAAAGAINLVKETEKGQKAAIAPSLLKWIDNLLAGNEAALESDAPDWRAIWNDLRKLAPQWLPLFLPLARLLDKLSNPVNDSSELALQMRENPEALTKTASNPIWFGAERIISGMVRGVLAKLEAGEALDILDYGDWPSLLSEDMEGGVPAGRINLQSRTEPEEFKNQASASADIVIARNVLHKSMNLADSLRSLQNSMRPGGLLLIEERHPDWSAVLLEGLEESWWKKDGEGKPAPARMWPEDWQKILENLGFENVKIYLEEEAGGLPQGAFVISANKARLIDGQEQSFPEKSWLLLPEKGAEELADKLGSLLTHRGQTVFRGTLSGVSAPQADNVVFFADASYSNFAESLEKIGASLAHANASAWLVTRGGSLLPRLPQNYRAEPVQAMFTGFARVFNNETQGAPLNYIDIDPSLPADDAASILAEEFLSNADHEEATWTKEGRYQPKLLPLPSTAVSIMDRFRLDVPQPGKIDNLLWQALDNSSPGDGEIEAKVFATGLNFRDVMLSLGVLPEDALENGFAGAAPGLEFAGIVTRAGANAQNFAPGDRIAGFAPNSFASHVRTSAMACAKISDDIPFQIAASLPTIFVTAWYALHYLGKISAGESILVHGGAGGVGLAAIQIAQQAGAKVFATAGSPEKRDLLRLLGVDLVSDSRSLAFVEEIMAKTNGKGVDLVLNSLAGEPMRRSLRLLKPFGRFLELGKRDYVENTPISLAPFKENISYFSIDVDQLLSGRPELARQLFTEVMEVLNRRVFLPPPVHVFPASKIVPAFRAMQHSRQIGKIVVDMEKAPAVSITSTSEGIADKTGTWLVTGGLSGFGLATAKHLAELGVKNLALAGRQGKASPGYSEIEDYFASRNVNLLVEACDVTDQGQVEKLIGKIQAEMPPLKGIVHAAAIFDDRQLKDMDAASYERVAAPKLLGALNLHEATRNLPLRYFILYSSVSVAIGNPGQANYVAANAGLEALARERIRMGLPASCIAWGPIGDCGYLDRNSRVRSLLEKQMGSRSLTVNEAMEEFDRFAGKDGIHILANVDWQKIAGGLAHAPSRYSGVASGDGAEQVGGMDWLEKIAQAPREAATSRLQECIVAETVKVLGLSAADIPAGKSLAALGLDSLMAMELATGIEQATGLRLPPMLMQDAPSIAQLAERLYERVTGSFQEVSEPDAMLAELARKHAESLAPEESQAVLAAMRAEQK